MNWDLVAENDLMPSSTIQSDASALDLKEIVDKLGHGMVTDPESQILTTSDDLSV